MRAYLHVTETAATMHLPGTSNRCADAITQGPKRFAHLKPGWYRAQATWVGNGRGGGWWSCDAGRKVDPSAEALRLERMAERNRGRTARTHSPGISGYQEAERASTGAIVANVQVNEHFADLLGRVA